MKNKCTYFFILSLVSIPFYCLTKNDPSAITWEPNGGRFGDNLLSYSRAKWLSYQYNIPLLYLPFRYSDQLRLHQNENMYSLENVHQFKKTIRIPAQFDSSL